MLFQNRTEAGRWLAGALAEHEWTSPVVLALPRGGVPVAWEVASALGAPLEVFLARKVGAPGQPEFGIGAVAESGEVVADEASLQALQLSRAAFERLVEVERGELDRRVRHYRGDRALPELQGRDVVLVDDGLATGVTAEAALRALRARHPRRLVLAVPVGAAETAARLARIADEVVCGHQPSPFYAVGLYYGSFHQTTDEEVLDLVARASARAQGVS